MIIKYLGHAAFLITSQTGLKVITDPYHPARDLKYTPIDEKADIVTKSHDHNDHNAVEVIKGQPLVISTTGGQVIKGITIKGIASFHDEQAGSQRGKNIIYCFNIDTLNICHLGDLGHPLNAAQLTEIGPVDILLIPVGGFFTIDEKTAQATATALKARVTIPMHYKTIKTEIPISSIEGFLKDRKNVRWIEYSSLEITPETLPSTAETVVLQPANI